MQKRVNQVNLLLYPTLGLIFFKTKAIFMKLHLKCNEHRKFSIVTTATILQQP
jgi:hypothetical protein